LCVMFGNCSIAFSVFKRVLSALSQVALFGKGVL